MAKFMFGLGLLSIIFSIQSAFAMDCTLGTSKNVVDQFINTCPRPIIDKSDEEFCCLDREGRVYCCNYIDFMMNGMGLLVLIIGVLVVSFIVSCICCLCCPCCCMYKRRASGGRVLQPGLMVSVHSHTYQQQPPYYGPTGASPKYQAMPGMQR